MNLKVDNIIKHLGKEWLEKQTKLIEKRDWVFADTLGHNVPNTLAYLFFEKINDLIGRFEKIKGFSQWVIEAKTTKTFEDHLFELMALDNLLSKSDLLILKPINPNTPAISEALVQKDGESFYVEMQKLRDLPDSIDKKVLELFKKAGKKFRGSQGIFFLGAFAFFDYPNGKKQILSEFNLLKKYIELRFQRGFGSSVLAFIITNFVINTGSDFKKIEIGKDYYIIPKPINKGGKLPKFFREIFDVDKFETFKE